MGGPGPGNRCAACGRKLAESIELKAGRVVITCRNCKRANVFTERGQTLN